MIPREAVLEVDGKQFVYVVEGAGQYVKREVKVSTISPDQVHVLRRPDIGTTHRDQRSGLDQGAGSRRFNQPGRDAPVRHVARGFTPPSNWNLIAPHDSQNC